jgi:hypothetical protein
MLIPRWARASAMRYSPLLQRVRAVLRAAVGVLA